MLWQLPISARDAGQGDDHSKIADLMQHNIDTFGGALYAAAFLQQFVGETRWAHLDIAGPGVQQPARRRSRRHAAAPEPR